MGYPYEDLLLTSYDAFKIYPLFSVQWKLINQEISDQNIKSWAQTVLEVEKRLRNFKFLDFAYCCPFLKCFALICLIINFVTFMICSKYFARKLTTIYSFKIICQFFFRKNIWAILSIFLAILTISLEVFTI